MRLGAVICEYGHLRSKYLRPGEPYDRICEECGQRTLIACDNCSTPLRGKESGTFGPLTIPNFCRQCATPYPWTLLKAEQLKSAIALYAVGNFSDEEAADLQHFADEVASNEASEPRIRSVAELMIARLGKSAKILLDGAMDIGTSVVAKVAVEAMKSHGIY